MNELTQLVPDKCDFKDISKLVDYKFKNYTDEAKLEMKIAIILNKTLKQIQQCNTDTKNDLEELKNRLYSSTNLKNKNLLMLNIEEEVNKEEFKKYIIDKINKEGRLNTLFEQKKKNELVINANKAKIKKDENFLLETFYCVKCHIRPRNAISKNCHHLTSCDECIEKTKVCPRCGMDINKYEKIYRC
jgi:hypothetical protein